MDFNQIKLWFSEIVKNAVKETMAECLPQLFKLFLDSSRPTFPERLSLDQALPFLAENGLPTTSGNIYKMSAKGEIPCDRIGKRLIFSKTDLLNWIESRSVRKTDGIEKTAMAVSKSARNQLNQKNKFNGERRAK